MINTHIIGKKIPGGVQDGRTRSPKAISVLSGRLLSRGLKTRLLMLIKKKKEDHGGRGQGSGHAGNIEQFEGTGDSSHLYHGG